MISPAFAGMGNNRLRMRHILGKIPMLAEVACLQEVFSRGARREVRRWALTHGWWCVTDNRKGAYGVGVNSGLAIISQYPITQSHLESYKDYAGDENMAKKGIIHAEITYGTKRYNIYSTHLQAGGMSKSVFRFIDRIRRRYYASAKTIKQRQLDQGRKFIIENGIENAILVGDFNLTYSDVSPELASLNPHDIFDASGSGYQCTNHQLTKRIDLMIRFSEDEIAKSATITDEFGAWTDHMGVIAII
jgi:endonuclease/exonuclease/phosphatase family metal-dependent hydrolase